MWALLLLHSTLRPWLKDEALFFCRCVCFGVILLCHRMHSRSLHSRVGGLGQNVMCSPRAGTINAHSSFHGCTTHKIRSLPAALHTAYAPHTFHVFQGTAVIALPPSALGSKDEALFFCRCVCHRMHSRSLHSNWRAAGLLYRQTAVPTPWHSGGRACEQGEVVRSGKRPTAPRRPRR